MLLILGLYLSIYNGRLALWDTRYPEPVEVFPYQAGNYPKLDQQALQDGIPITNRKQLEKLLEDLMS